MAKLGKQLMTEQPVDALPEFPGDAPVNVEESTRVSVETFSDLPQQGALEPEAVDPDALRQYERDHRFVEVRTRVHVPRTRICGQWYNFTANKTAIVPKYVRDWLNEQGVL